MVERYLREMDNWKEIHHSKNVPLKIISIYIVGIFLLVGMCLFILNAEYDNNYEPYLIMITTIFGILIFIWAIIDTFKDTKSQIVRYNNEKIVHVVEDEKHTEIIWDHMTIIEVMDWRFWNKLQIYGLVISRNEEGIILTQRNGWLMNELKKSLPDLLRICEDVNVQIGNGYQEFVDNL